MNVWIKKSFELHDSDKYLDRLHDIYPMLENEVRPIESKLKSKIKLAYDSKNSKELFKLLLPLKKFPIKDSYKAYFTNCTKEERNKVIERNENTVSRICNRLYAIGWDKMLEGLEEPIETNRQIGPMFRNWTRRKYISYDNPISFMNSNETISILNASDDGLARFVQENLNVALPLSPEKKAKGLDIVVKVNTQPIPTYVIGETKFLTDTGGHQNAQLKDALHLLNSPDFKNSNPNINIIRIAVLDGVCWINTKNSKMQNEIKGLGEDKIAISALLLDDLFNSLLK